MTADADGIAKHRLRTRYLGYRENRFFAAEGLLWGLGRNSWLAVGEEAGSDKLVAIVLALIFCDAASRLDGRSVTDTQGTEWFDLMDQPIMQCLDILVGRTEGPPEPALADLAAAYDTVRAQISN